jgi:hypothetical protein
MHRTRNAAYGQPYRGFESLPLRQDTFRESFRLRERLRRSRDRCARLDVGLDKLAAACGTVRFALPLLIWNRDIVLGLVSPETIVDADAGNGLAAAGAD